MSNEIIKQDAAEISVSEQSAGASVQVASAWSTISAQTYEDKLKIASMLNAAESLNGHEGEEFMLREVFFKPGVRRGRNGNADQACTDTYLLTSDGVVYFTKSEGVSRSVRNILMVIPDLNTPDGVRVRIDSVTLGNGNTYKQLVPVM